MISMTKLNILKTLRDHPSYGLEIANRLSITVSSIYKHLIYLLENGFIDIKEIGSKSTRYKKIYQLTEKGEKLITLLTE